MGISYNFGKNFRLCISVYHRVECRTIRQTPISGNYVKSLGNSIFTVQIIDTQTFDTMLSINYTPRNPLIQLAIVSDCYVCVKIT